MANRISQLPVEVVYNPDAHIRLSQMVVEVIFNPNSHVRMSQMAIEVIQPYERPVTQVILEFQNP